MLKDGKFIKEDPVKIGVYYIPPLRKDMNDEELFMQNSLLFEKKIENFDWTEIFVTVIVAIYVLLGVYAWLE